MVEHPIGVHECEGCDEEYMSGLPSPFLQALLHGVEKGQIRCWFAYVRFSSVVLGWPAILCL